MFACLEHEKRIDGIHYDGSFSMNFKYLGPHREVTEEEILEVGK